MPYIIITAVVIALMGLCAYGIFHYRAYRLLWPFLSALLIGSAGVMLFINTMRGMSLRAHHNGAVPDAALWGAALAILGLFILKYVAGALVWRYLKTL